MNRKQLLLVLAALAIVGSAGLVLFKQNKESWNQAGAKMGEKVLPDFRPNDVAAIHVKGDSEVHLIHTNDLWRVSERNGYPANFGKISDFLIKLQALKVVEAETVGPSQLARVNLEEPGGGSASGTLVEFMDNRGKVLEALLLGKKHMKEKAELSRALVAGDADGRYIRLRKDPKNVLLISDALAGIDPKPEQWVSKDFFRTEKVKSVSLAAPNATNSWKIIRESESAPWVLADAKPGEVLDGKKATMAANALNSPRFVEVFPAGDPAGAGSNPPAIVTTETFDHFVYTLKLGPKGPDDNYRVTVTVTANISTERIAGKDETPEDRKKLDAEFQEKNRKLQDKLKREQALASWAYSVNAWLLDPATRDRAQMLEGAPDTHAIDAANTAAAAAAKQAKPAWTPRVIQ